MEKQNNLISKEIIETYFNYRHMIFKNYMPMSDLNVVIVMKPKYFIKLEHEIFSTLDRPGEMECKNGIHFIFLGGKYTPIIIDDTLSDNTKFKIISKEEYETEEQNKLLLDYWGD